MLYHPHIHIIQNGEKKQEKSHKNHISYFSLKSFGQEYKKEYNMYAFFEYKNMQNQDIVIIGPFRFKKSKSIFLQKERGTSFENLILDGEIIESIQSTNPDYNGQKMLVIHYKNYPWCIPYRKKEDEDGVFFELATAFPRRTLKKQYPHIFTL